MPGGILPFRQFVLKVHSRCDLACDHCYVFEHADQSWRDRPRVISEETVAKAAERIAEHARHHHLPGVRVILHGGEPLLAGAPRLAQIVTTLRQAVEPVCDLDLRIHTNGVRLDEEFCELFAAHRVKVGISLDGDRAANDLHRRYADGRSSYDQVVRAVNLLRTDRYRGLYLGLLCTIDVRNDPIATYNALGALSPPLIDFLLPHGTWDNPPPGTGEGTPYADWLAAIFDQWAGEDKRVPVRMFESIMRTTHGRSSLTEALGIEAADVVVIETDGAIEQADSIKVAYDGAPATGLDIFRHALNDAASHPAIIARQKGIAGLSAVCRQCPVVITCGGGLYAHRFSTVNDFDNPSVYCADLEKIITHVRARMRPPAAPSGQERPGLLPYSLPASHFDALAAGYGDGESIEHLIRSQQSVQRTLLRLLHERAGRGVPGLFLAGWELITRLEREHAAVLNEVIAHPYVRAWAESCLRTAADGGSPPADADHLSAIAAAAAIRSGALAEIDVPVTQGYVHLPTLGRLRVGTALAASVATGGEAFEVRAASGKWRVSTHDPRPVAGWEPVRELRAGQFTARLDDIDPYRDCHHWPTDSRLSEESVARWQRQFEAAWRLIEREHGVYAPAMAAGISTIMPLANHVTGREISAAARPAFGSVGAALPHDGDALALVLIHEFQHVKLGGLLDLFDLCDPAERRLFDAPWREDPRPIEALLQGAYAHIAVTDYWRARRHYAPAAEALIAAERFARWRELTAEAIGTLAGSGSLTSLGIRFVSGMRATVEPWLDESVPEAAAAQARKWIVDRKERWQRQQHS